jgi:hypothetical protein
MTLGSRIPKSGVFTGLLALFLLLNGFALNGILWRVSPEPYKETVLKHTWDVLGARGCDDSWGIMSVSLQYAREKHDTPLYTEIFFNQHLKFQYPPSSLFAIAALLWAAGPDRVRTEECTTFDTPTLNDILGWLFILMSALSAAALLDMGLRDKLPASRPMRVLRAAIVVGFALTFYPMVKAFTLGQIQVWLNGLFALALLCWATGHKVPSGVLIACMCLVKPHYGIFVLWAALRREWRFSIAFTVTVAVVLAASVAAYGFANHIDYIPVLKFLAERGETYYPNQSVNGLLNRVMVLIRPGEWDSINFDDHSFPPYSPLVYWGTVTSSIVLLGTALVRRGKQGDPDRLFDFCTMAVSIAVASPIAWEHHHGIVFPILAVLLAASVGNRTRLIAFTVCYVFISNFIPATNLMAASVFNVVQSYLFFAVIVVLVMLHMQRPGWQIELPAPSER